jgi:hypothetical protein
MTPTSPDFKSHLPGAVFVNLTAHPVIVATTVTRNREGYWSHPGYQGFPLGSPECVAWTAAQGLETKRTDLDDEPAEHAVVKSYFEEGNADVTAWHPAPPAGEGWFMLSLDDSDTGPYCVWGRRVRSTVPEAPALAE